MLIKNESPRSEPARHHWLGSSFWSLLILRRKQRGIRRFKNKQFQIVILLLLIFSFWFVLSKDNYFHWDEWKFFADFRFPPEVFLLKSFSSHFIPLNFLHHYLLFSIFGLNYLPFQFSVNFFHAINAVLLFILIKQKTGRVYLAFWIAILFGLANAPVENLVWSLGVNFILAGFTVFTAYWFSLHQKHLPALILLILSPLFHGFTLLFPLAFAIFFRKKIFLLPLIINLGLIRIFSNASVSIDIWGILLFIFNGVFYGTILKFFIPHLYFTNPVIPHLRTAALGAGLLWYILWGQRLFPWKKVLLNFLGVLPFLVCGYLAAAPARMEFGPGAPVISRYSYIPLFFFLLFLAEIWPKTKLISKKLTVLFLGLFIAMQIFASINFSLSYWKPMVNRDRRFISDVKNMFIQNDKVANLPVPGINEVVKISDFWFLIPPYKTIIFTPDGAKTSEEYFHKVD